jgi:hypothetical protein
MGGQLGVSQPQLFRLSASSIYIYINIYINSYDISHAFVLRAEDRAWDRAVVDGWQLARCRKTARVTQVGRGRITAKVK